MVVSLTIVGQAVEYSQFATIEIPNRTRCVIVYESAGAVSIIRGEVVQVDSEYAIIETVDLSGLHIACR